MTNEPKSPKSAPKDKVQGEGDYDAARRYDKGAEKFVADRKGQIEKLAEDAEQALEGPEGDELRKSEEIGKSKARH